MSENNFYKIRQEYNQKRDDELQELSKAFEGDPRFSKRHIYDRLEKCCDACEKVMEMVELVITKNS